MNAFPTLESNKFNQLWQKDNSLSNNYILCLYLLLITLFTISCAERNTNIGRKVAVSSKYPKVQFPTNSLITKNHLKGLESPAQIFFMDGDSTNEATFTGKAGTVVTIRSGCLTYGDGTPLKGPIKVELIELNNKADMALNNKPTISNGEVLVTGGSIYINATCNGKNLKINCMDGVSISMPVRDQYPGMEMFLGKISDKGNINWIKDSSISEMPSGVIEEESYFSAEEEYLVDGYTDSNYIAQRNLETKAFSTSKFGWINCDAFYEDNRNKVKVIVKVNNRQENGATTRVYLFFKNLNSVLPVYNESKDYFATSLIPEGEEVYLVTLSALDKRYFMNVKPIIVADHLIESISLKECSEKELKEEIQKLN